MLQTPEFMTNRRLTSKLLHTRFPKKDPHGSLNFPVYDNVAFEAENAEELEAAFQGAKFRHIYSRISNPTVEYFEEKIRSITDAFAVTATSSGMAAISNLIMTIGKAGDNIITTRHLFGNTLSLFEKTLKPYNLEARYTDLTNPTRLAEQIDAHTIAIFFETITNPQLEVADIKMLSGIARKNNLLLIADTTMTPPTVCNGRDLGVDIEVMSTTKYISGGATSVGGIIVDYGTFDWSRLEKMTDAFEEFGPFAFNVLLRKEVFRNLGACLSPHNAYLQNLGLDTLVLRSECSTSNTLELAKWLEVQPGVRQVHYPGLKSSPFYSIAIEQFGEQPCSLLTFDLASKAQCFTFMNGLKMVRRTTNLQDNKTLIIHPASTIFAEYTDDQKTEMGLRDTMIRLSVGIEELEAITEDFDQAFRNIK